jgi:hypothetical protein
MPNKYLLGQAGGLRNGKTFLGRTILHGVAVWMKNLTRRGAQKQ